MKAALLPAIVSFVVVFAIGSNLRAQNTPEPTTSPLPLSPLPAMKCAVAEPDCTKLAEGFLLRLRAQNPGKTVVSLVIIDANSYEACFNDGSCFGESSGSGRAGQPGVALTPEPEPAPVETPPPGG